LSNGQCNVLSNQTCARQCAASHDNRKPDTRSRCCGAASRHEPVDIDASNPSLPTLKNIEQWFT
jgi:hypothetical protein